ncbi:MAG: alkaline phosphatase family protein [Planctomycetota bacterium]
MFLSKKKTKRVIVLGLDGFAHSLLSNFMDQGVTPNLKTLAAQGTLSRINSVYPTVSNVAWASFQTGTNPGEFGIFGFAELDRNLGLFIPNAGNLKTSTMWKRLSDAGKRIVSLGMPMSFPPRRVNGCVVGGFLASSLDKAVSDAKLLRTLRGLGYLLDIDPLKARESTDYLKDELHKGLAGRRRALAYFFEKETWDLLCLHVMETDRINHFMWKCLDEGGADREFFLDFYRAVDALVGDAMGLCGEEDTIVVLSDHGFCRVKNTVELNRWLMQEGLLAMDVEPNPMSPFRNVSPRSKALSLVPGRIHILTPSYWADGAVSKSDREAVRKDIVSRLKGFKTADGQTVCKQIFAKEDIYTGPHTDRAPDIIVAPVEGYDLKAALSPGPLFSTDIITGMHTYDDAFLCIRGGAEASQAGSITEAGRLVEELAGAI